MNDANVCVTPLKFHALIGFEAGLRFSSNEYGRRLTDVIVIKTVKT